MFDVYNCAKNPTKLGTKASNAKKRSQVKKKKTNKSELTNM
jgi:hypothetical protein